MFSPQARWLAVLSCAASSVLAVDHNAARDGAQVLRREHAGDGTALKKASAHVDAHGDVVSEQLHDHDDTDETAMLLEESRNRSSPFCRSLCGKTDIATTDHKTCRDLSEGDCRSAKFYTTTKTGERRLCLWQPTWQCTEDWTTMCAEGEQVTCDQMSILVDRDVCASFCYKTDARSVDLTCAMLNMEECSSGQFYESDSDGHRRLCAPQQSSQTCAPDHDQVCKAGERTCPASVQSFEGSGKQNVDVCRSLCYTTNLGMAGLACKDLDRASCSSASYFGTDVKGDRRRCELSSSGECHFSLTDFCEASVPACSTMTISGSDPKAKHSDMQSNASQEVTSAAATSAATANTLPPSIQAADVTPSAAHDAGEHGAEHTTPNNGVTSMQSNSESQKHEEATDALSGSSKAPSLERTEAHAEAPSQTGPPVDSACLAYCHRTNVRSMNRSCIDLSLIECASDHFYETDRTGHRMMCVQLKSGDCGADLTTLCENWKLICEGVAKPNHMIDTMDPVDAWSANSLAAAAAPGNALAAAAASGLPLAAAAFPGMPSVVLAPTGERPFSPDSPGEGPRGGAGPDRYGEGAAMDGEVPEKDGVGCYLSHPLCALMTALLCFFM
eukprot:gb/GFBE01062766.1/.p1 GENE.gb/GFBE01062766.1/~~gb/GFBE01062766.1/.p1  ORF type:complete len:615 (+),score=99.70 gb/GFBE01062766.1/:1-1845(+)